MELIKNINNLAAEKEIIEPVVDDQQQASQENNGKSISDYLSDIQNNSKRA